MCRPPSDQPAVVCTLAAPSSLLLYLSATLILRALEAGAFGEFGACKASPFPWVPPLPPGGLLLCHPWARPLPLLWIRPWNWRSEGGGLAMSPSTPTAYTCVLIYAPLWSCRAAYMFWPKLLPLQGCAHLVPRWLQHPRCHWLGRGPCRPQRLPSASAQPLRPCSRRASAHAAASQHRPSRPGPPRAPHEKPKEEP
jgi:hypothetical protein